MVTGWTLTELTERAAQALSGVAAPNGRVRDTPDARAVRWYATVGLVDRPLPVPGRTARYGPRHLLQLVAVKRRQAEGRSLAQIQAELTGATDETLGRIARIPAALLDGDREPARPVDGEPAAAAPVSRARFWADGAVPAVPPGPGADPLPSPTSLTVTYQVALPGGVTLGLPRPPSAADLAALAPASSALLAALAARDLLDTDPATPAIHEGDAP
jgi:hypothetical protein